VGLGDFSPNEFPFDATRAEDLRSGANFRLETQLGDLDIMRWVAGIESEPLMRRRPRMPSAANPTASWYGFAASRISSR